MKIMAQEPRETEPTEQETRAPQGPLVSAFDPDFMVMAFLALVVDVLDWVLEIGTIVSLFIGAFFIAWLTWRTGRSVNAQELQSQHTQQQEARQAAKTAVRKAVRRGVLVFIAELIPLINLIPFWIIFVLSALRQQPESAQGASEQQAGQPA